MKSFKSLTFKEKMEYIGILAIYPLILLYDQIGKSVKFLNSKSRQITASILTVCLMLTMIPLSAMTAFAATTGTGASVDDPYIVTTGDDFITAIQGTANTTNYIQLGACISLSGYIGVSNNAVVDLNGYTVNTDDSGTYISGSCDMTFQNGYIAAGSTAFFNSYSDSTGPDYILENLVVTNTGDICVYAGWTGTVTATNCSFTTAADTPIEANRNGAVFTLTDCYLQGASYAYKQSTNTLMLDGSSITGNASSATYDGGFVNSITRQHAPVSGTQCTVCDEVSTIPDYYITLDDGVVYKNNNQAVLDGADYGITVSGNETDGYTYTFTNVDFSTSVREAFRIHDTKPATIVLVGENKITLTTAIDDMTYAINSSTSLIIKGDGSLVATGADSPTRMAFGIYVFGDLTVESGSITAIAGSGKTMSGGLYVDGTLTVTGGSVVGIGDRQGIYATTASVDGCVLTGSDNKDGTDATTITDLARTEKVWMKVEKPVHTHDNVTFDKEWTATSGNLTSGNYYLKESNAPALTDNITIPEGETVNLCLNGNTLNMGDCYIKIGKNAALNICDCSADKTGKITAAEQYTLYADYGTINLFSGTVENTYKNGWCIYATRGAINVSGGAVNSAKYCVYGSYSDINVYGDAKITASGDGEAAGIYHTGESNVNVYGDAEITATGIVNGNALGIYSKGSGTIKVYGNAKLNATSIYTGAGIWSSKCEVRVYDNAQLTGTSTQNTGNGIAITGRANAYVYGNAKVNASGNKAEGFWLYYESGYVYDNAVITANGTRDVYGVFLEGENVYIYGNAEIHSNQYGIYNNYGENIYLYGTPTVSGDVADIKLKWNDEGVYANDGASEAYTGSDEITVEIYGNFAVGDTVVYSVTDVNKDKFSVVNDGYKLKQSGDNLILAYSDETPPTGQITIGENGWLQFWNTVTFGIFCKDYVEIEITGADAEMGVKSIEYYLSDTAISDTEIGNVAGWQTYTDKINITANDKRFVYAKITDNAGNVTYLSVNGGIVVFTDTEITTGDYEYILTTMADIVTNIKPGNNTVASIDIEEPGGGAGNSLDYFVNTEGYIVLKGESLEAFTKNWYAGDYTVTVMYNALGETYVDGTSKGDKITDTVITLTVKRFKFEKPAADSTVFTYNGSEQTYTVAESEYYTVTGNKRTNAGEQDVTVALKDTNTFEWADGTTDNLTFKFNIGKATPNVGNVTVSSPEHIYFNTEIDSIVLGRTNEAVEGVLKLDAGQILTVGTKDYDWTFTPNDTANYNNATGKVSITVEKIKLDVSGKSWDISGSPFTYDGTEKSVALVGTLPAGVEVVKSGDTALNAANYTATATFSLAEGYQSGAYEIVGATDNKVSANWVINPKVVSAAVEVTPNSYTYTGEPVIPNSVMVCDGDNVIPASEYNVAYRDNTNSGTATVIVTDKEGGNYTVSGNGSFVITKATPVVAWPENLVGNQGDKLSTVALPAGFAWENGDTVIGYSNNEYSMVYTPADITNYNTVKANITVKGLDVTAPTGEITLKDNKWNEFLNNITFGLFFKETQSITITAADTESGIKEIAYYLSAEELSIDDVKALESSKWTVYTDAFNVEPDNKYVVYARITDNAGNLTYISSDGIVLDSIKPVIAGVEDGKDVYGDAVFTVDEEYLDTVTLDGEPIEVKDGKYSVPADNKEHTIVVTDKTGNAVTYKLTVYKNYKVSFVVDGEEIEASEVGYGKDANLPEIPGKDGYTAKWDVDGKNITADTVITAVYEKIPQSPQTGDNTNIWLWVAVMFVSGLFLFGIIIKQRKEEAAE